MKPSEMDLIALTAQSQKTLRSEFRLDKHYFNGSNPVKVQDLDDLGFRFRLGSRLINYKGYGSVRVQ